MVEKPPDLSTEKALSLIQPRTGPGQQSTKKQGAANRNRDVQAVQWLILNHVDEYQVLTQRRYKHEFELRPERQDADNENRQGRRYQHRA